MPDTTISPIALFVFARPVHTQCTLQALSRNELAAQTKLYIFADGPRNNAGPEMLAGIKRVREIIREQKWCGDVEIFESDINKGLARSIIDGVSLVTSRHGRVIVLEDDLETSPGFLRYMNDALNMYQNDDRVMQISGFNVRNRIWARPTGFLRVTTSWGWATWDRAWKYYDDDASSLMSRVASRGRERFDLDGHSFHFEELERNVRGELKTWAIRWYASIFLNEGLCLYPRRTLVRNLGFDGTGENCHDDVSRYHFRIRPALQISVNRETLCESTHYLQSMQRHFDYLRQLWSRTRIRDRILRRLKIR